LIGSGTTKPCSVKPFHFAEEGLTEEMIAILRQGDIILDCLPGSQAPRIAEFAKDYELHYANLTEYVAETENKDFCKRCHNWFIATPCSVTSTYSQTDFSTILYRF
jgi:hypothetical protein